MFFHSFIQNTFRTFYTGMFHLEGSLILEKEHFPVWPILFLFYLFFFPCFFVFIPLLSLKGNFPIAMPKYFFYGLTNLVSFLSLLHFVELFQFFRSLSVKNLFGVTKDTFFYIKKLRSLFVFFISTTQKWYCFSQWIM